ncbi:MAG: O-antigen ligase family protein [Smithella sp.]
MVHLSYVVSLAFLMTLTLASMSSHVVGVVYAAIGVPKGYYSFFTMVLAAPFLCIIVLKAEEKIIKPFWTVAKYWLPWIAYLFVSGVTSPEGSWKLKMYLGIVVLPCMLLIVMALANPAFFQKYFMKVLLAINVLLLIVLTLQIIEVRSIPGVSGAERMIWLSRGLGISAAYLIAMNAWKRYPIMAPALIVVLFGAMLYIGSRGPVISLILTIGLFWAVKYRKDVKTLFLIVWATAIIVIAIMNVDTLSSFAHSFATHKKAEKIERFGQDRLSVYEPTLRIFADNPVTGVGLGKWWQVFQKEVRIPSWMASGAREKRMRGELDVQYPHNIFLEILSELGLVGLVFFMLLFFPFKRLFSVDNEYNILCLLGFLYAFTSSDITQNATPMIFNLLSILRARGYLPAPEIFTAPSSVCREKMFAIRRSV